MPGQESVRSYAVNNNTVKNATKFTIGTSDESDEDDNEEDTQDLEHLFCPLTDSQVLLLLILSLLLLLKTLVSQLDI